ncbi:hypothetical protein V8C44DRAFT_121481 [Trichoderma aethiopicum]
MMMRPDGDRIVSARFSKWRLTLVLGVALARKSGPRSISNGSIGVAIVDASESLSVIRRTAAVDPASPPCARTLRVIPVRHVDSSKQQTTSPFLQWSRTLPVELSTSPSRASPLARLPCKQTLGRPLHTA